MAQLKAMVKVLLNGIKPEEKLEKDALIDIKPKPVSLGATTSPEIVAGLIEYLREKKYK
jgi:hypothetical protein